MLFGLIKNTNPMSENPEPQGTPTILMPIVVIIKAIRN
jgi:hypothetical protein